MARGRIVIAASQLHRRSGDGTPWRSGGADPGDPARRRSRGVRPRDRQRQPHRQAGGGVAAAGRSPPVVLPGRLTSWKGHAVLLEAIARLGRRDVMAVLVGAHQGRHRYARHLARLATDLGIGEQVRLVGQCDDMPAAFCLADVVVHASTKPEAFGRVVIEAQAMGRPVIASDLGGPVETVRHGETGWRVRPGDPDALAAAIAVALDLDPDDAAGPGRPGTRLGADGAGDAGCDAGCLRSGAAGRVKEAHYVMVRAGGPSTPCGAGCGKGVDGRPSPAMTGRALCLSGRSNPPVQTASRLVTSRRTPFAAARQHPRAADRLSRPRTGPAAPAPVPRYTRSRPPLRLSRTIVKGSPDVAAAVRTLPRRRHPHRTPAR